MVRAGLLGGGWIVLGCLAAAAALAQPVEWSRDWPTPFGNLIADPAGQFYVARLGYIDRLDADGRTLWTVPRPALCLECLAFATIGGADAGSVYYVMHEYIGPMRCALGCSRASAYRQPADGGAVVGLYATPMTTPPVADIGITAGLHGEVVVVGQDASGGFLVRLAPTRLERRHGSAMGPAVVTAAGDMIVTGIDGGTGFLRRYDATGAVVWTTSTGRCSRLAFHPAHGIACLVVANSGFGTVDLFDVQGTLLRHALADDVAAVAFDDAGRLWTAGRGCGGGCASLKQFTVPGTLAAETTLDDPGATSEWRALAIAPDGDVYTTGLVRPLPAPTFMPSDMLTARHDGSARRLWQVRVNGAFDWNDAGVNIVATPDGAVALGSFTDTGLYTWSGSFDTLRAIKYGRNALVAPSIVLSATPAPARAGQAIVATATVSGATLPTGTVTFAAGPITLCAAVPLLPAGATTATATCAFAAPSMGQLALRAAYGGDGSFAAADANFALSVLDGATAEVPGPAPWVLALAAAILAALGAGHARRRRSR